MSLPILDIEDGIITEVTDDAPLNMLLPSNINPEIRITEVRRVTPSNTASPSIIIIIIIIIKQLNINISIEDSFFFTDT